MSTLPSFSMFVPPTIGGGDEEGAKGGYATAEASLMASQAYNAQVWPPPPPSMTTGTSTGRAGDGSGDVSVIWCGCSIERQSPAFTPEGSSPHWLPLPPHEIRFGAYLSNLHKVGLGDLVVGRFFQPWTGAGSGYMGNEGQLSEGMRLVEAMRRGEDASDNKSMARSAFDLTAARSLVAYFERCISTSSPSTSSSSGFKSRDLQLFDIVQTVLTHSLGPVRSPNPYPKMPRLGLVVLCKQNSMLMATMENPNATSSKITTKKVTPSSSSSSVTPKLPPNLTLSPHVHRSLILASAVESGWFSRNVLAKYHLAFDLAELLQCEFEEIFTLTMQGKQQTMQTSNDAHDSSSASHPRSAASSNMGLRQLLSRILQASMLHRQRDRKKFAKKIETLRKEFFDNHRAQQSAAAAAVVVGEEAEQKQGSQQNGSSPSVDDSPASALSPALLWERIERLERVKELHREIGRLHPYTEIFLRLIQCYELRSDEVCEVIVDVLTPYVCQALQECQPEAMFVVETRPHAPHQQPSPAPAHKAQPEQITPVVEREEPPPAPAPAPAPPPPPAPPRPAPQLALIPSENILAGGYETSEVLGSVPMGGATDQTSASADNATTSETQTSLNQSLTTDTSSNEMLTGPLTADSTAADEDGTGGVSEQTQFELDADGNLQPIQVPARKKKVVTLPKSVARELRMKRAEKQRRRELEKKQALMLSHMQHIDSLQARRARMQLEEIERVRTAEIVVEEEKWWLLFVKNLAAGVGAVQVNAVAYAQVNALATRDDDEDAENGKREGVETKLAEDVNEDDDAILARLSHDSHNKLISAGAELAHDFLSMASRHSKKCRHLPLILEAETAACRLRRWMSEGDADGDVHDATPSSVSMSHPPSKSVTHSYQDLQYHAICLSMAYRFSLCSLNTNLLSLAVRMCSRSLSLMVVLCERGVSQPLEIVLRGILVHEYSSIRLLFAHAAKQLGLPISPNPSESVISRALAAPTSRRGLNLLQHVSRALTPADHVLFRQMLERFVGGELWSAEAMVNLPSASTSPSSSSSSSVDLDSFSNSIGVLEERYLLLLRFLGLFRLQAHHFLRQATSVLGHEVVACMEDARRRTKDTRAAARDDVHDEKEQEQRSEEKESTAGEDHANASDHDSDDNDDSLTSDSYRKTFLDHLPTPLPTLPPPSHLVYARNALRSALQYLALEACRSAQDEAHHMLLFVEHQLHSPTTSHA